MTTTRLPQEIRVSVGSAMVLELVKGRLDAPPTTIYLLTYHKGRCLANCGFCPQARKSTSRADMLSRVVWPTFPTQEVVSKVASAWHKKAIRRVCIQATNYSGVFGDLLGLAKEILSRAKVPVSVSCQPLNRAQMEMLAEVGVDRVSVALDAATAELFDKVKGSATCSPYSWEKQLKTLEEAVQVFGKGKVSTHLIVGLGESERQLIETVQWCVDSGVYPSLFAFTPVSGTALEGLSQPSVASYRRVQLARHLIVQGETRCENIRFDDDGRIIDFGVTRHQLRNVLKSGSPFQTSGCPGCNRPYYNERPGGPIFNYPRPLKPNELIEVEKLLEI